MSTVADAEPVDAPIDTVGGLRAACTYAGDDEAENDYRFGLCLGAVRGMAIAAQAIADAAGRDTGMCLPDDVEDQQVVDVAAEALDAWHGEDGDSPAPAVLSGLLAAFPCTADPLETD